MIVHGRRSPRHAPAYISSGFAGFIASETTPVRSLMKSTFFQLLPPSVVLNTPRSELGPNGWPRAATYATSALRGWIFNAPICPTSGRPAKVQLFPASVDL